MIPRLRPNISKDELNSVIFGKSSVADFEIEFASFTDQRHAIAFPYGRTALYILLKALNIENKEIIVPAYTCVVVPHAIVSSGNKPIFVDCSQNDPNMNFDLIQEKISKKTKAIIVTSIFGNPINLKKLNKIREKNPQLFIIQDCAHSFLTRSENIETHKQGIAAFFGMNFGKMITSIFGGMITTDDDKLAYLIREKRDQLLISDNGLKSITRMIYLFLANASLSPFFYKFVYKIKEKGLIDNFVKYYKEDKIDMPRDFLKLMTSTEAKVGIQQIRKYKKIVSNRKKLAMLYNEYLKGCPGIILPKITTGSTYTFYAPRVRNRQEVISLMAKRGIELGNVLEYSIPYMKSYSSDIDQTYPNSLNYAKSVINLPMHICEKKCIYVASELKNILTSKYK